MSASVDISQLLVEAMSANLLDASDRADVENKVLILEQKSDGAEVDQGNSKSDSTVDDPERVCRELQLLIQRMREAPSGPKGVDAAYKVYVEIRSRCTLLCEVLLCQQHHPRDGSGGGAQPLVGRSGRASREETPGARRVTQGDRQEGEEEAKVLKFRRPQPSSSSRRLAPTRSDSSLSAAGGRQINTIPGSSPQQTPGANFNEGWFAAVKEWRNCLEVLQESFRETLLETLGVYDRNITPEMAGAMFKDKTIRAEAIGKMRRANAAKIRSASPDVFSKYEIRFHGYDKITQELADLNACLQTGESGITPDREIQEIVIVTHGDAVLEFANRSTEDRPVLRFRVSSHMLRATSPIFALMFASDNRPEPLAAALDLYGDDDDEDIATLLPPLPPTRHTCSDGTEALLYRMTQQEHNPLRSLEILLHAAHMQNDKLPRDIPFEQFVAVAQACLRYRCTSPLELVVEHRWLPAWMHMATEEMPDGLLLISYTFGSRQLFTRMCKTAILNVVDEHELAAKPWPKRIKDKIWALRSAKMAQVNAACVSAVREYLRPPAGTAARDEGLADVRGGDAASPTTQALASATGFDPSSPPPLPGPSSTSPPLRLTSTPRCPKGSHACDAANLGWLLLVLGELQLLQTVFRPTTLGHLPHAQQAPQRSLAQVVEMLRTTTSPPQPIHRGVCDPAPAFRTAVNDIYNSVSGLTLFDVSGKKHGWAISRRRAQRPQAVLRPVVKRIEELRGDRSEQRARIDKLVNQIPESVRLKILTAVGDLDDLYAVGRISRGFYATFRKNELELMRNILRIGRRGRQPRREDTVTAAPVGASAVTATMGQGGALRLDFSGGNGLEETILWRRATAVAETASVRTVQTVDGITLPSNTEETDLYDDGNAVMEDDEEENAEFERPGGPADPQIGDTPEAVPEGSPPAWTPMASSATFKAEKRRVDESDYGAGLRANSGYRPVSTGGDKDLQKEKFLAGDPAIATDKTFAVMVGHKQLGQDRETRLGFLRRDEPPG